MPPPISVFLANEGLVDGRRLYPQRATSVMELTATQLAVAEDCHMYGKVIESTFEPWMGQSVVVQLALGRVKLSVRGTCLEDRGETLLVRPEVGSDVEIPKTKILAIEEARRWTEPMITFL